MEQDPKKNVADTAQTETPSTRRKFLRNGIAAAAGPRAREAPRL